MSNLEEHVSGDEVRDAINRYNQDMTEPNLMEVARLLKDAWMWIPCTMYLSDNDQKRLSEFIMLLKQELLSDRICGSLLKICNRNNNYFVCIN